MSTNQEKLNEQLFNVIANEKASSEARLKKLKYLVRLGADVNTRLYGKSVLSKAIEQNVGIEVQNFLREKGANEWVIPKEEALEVSQGFWNDKGDLKSLEEIKELLKKGADVNASDKYGSTALMKAANLGKLDVVKCLAECGADLDAKDNDGQTALIKAAINGQLAVVKYLTEQGADVEAKDDTEQTALIKAVNWEKLDVVKYLKDRGVDVHQKDKYGQTALDVARKWGKDDCVKFLEECQSKEEGDRKKGIWGRMFVGRD